MQVKIARKPTTIQDTQRGEENELCTRPPVRAPHAEPDGRRGGATAAGFCRLRGEFPREKGKKLKLELQRERGDSQRTKRTKGERRKNR